MWHGIFITKTEKTIFFKLFEEGVGTLKENVDAMIQSYGMF